MSLSSFSRQKALRFAIDTIRQANPTLRTDVGSVLRALLVLPYSFLNSQLFEDIDELRQMNLANAENISETDMNILASNLIVSRPQGTKSITTLRVYPIEIQSFSVTVSPYFYNIYGQRYLPIRAATYTEDSYVSDENGDFYVNISIISENSGTDSISSSGEISKFKDFPIKLSKVVNPDSTSGGSPSMSNLEFYDFISSEINNRSLTQAASIVSELSPLLPTAQDIQVFDSSSPKMIRDELWSSDGIYPNLIRSGEPFTEHIDAGSIDFDISYGRGYTETDLSSYIGKRINLSGDIYNFRTILNATSEYIIVSGITPQGEFDCTIYNDAPKVSCMADVYVYVPFLEIKSFILNNSTDAVSSNISTTYVDVDYEPSLIMTLVIDEGTDNEQIFGITAVSQLANGNFRVTLDSSLNTSIATTESTFKFYDMMNNELPEKPCLYVLRVDELDPLSFETLRSIPQGGPGEYDDPGWYFTDSDPAYIFSTRESKILKLDEKRDNTRYSELLVEGIRAIGTSLDGGENTIIDNTSTIDFTDFIARRVKVTVLEQTLAIPEVGTASAGTAVFTYDGVEGATNTLNVNGLDAEYIIGDLGTEGIEGQKRLYVKTWGDVAEYKNIIGRGDKLINPSGSWPAGITSLSVKGYGTSSSSTQTAFEITPTPVVVNETTYDSITTRCDGYEFDVLIPDGINIKWNNDDTTGAYCLVDVLFDKQNGNFASRPVRIVYATSSEFQTAQDFMDENRSPANDILVRSFFPSIIDTSLSYRGASSVSEVREKFIDLISSSVRSTANEEEFIMDIADIVSTLDTTSPGDWYSTNFEVRVTNFLKDGKHEVRYLNPSSSTKHQKYITTAVSISDTTIVCNKGTVVPSGKGKLFLGGNNPDTQEVLVYESVVEDTDSYIFVLRGETSYSHSQWETVFVTSIDYDPELEYLDETIIIPAGNKPYVRNLVIRKLA